MARGYTHEKYRRIIDTIREYMPDAAISADAIVGFPGETEEYFETLLNFIRETKFERMGVFTYSKEPGTPAVKLDGHLPEAVKEERRDALMKLQQQIAFEQVLKADRLDRIDARRGRRSDGWAR